MTPQLVPPPDAGQGGAHLTGEQFGELLSRFTETPEGELTPAEVHLRACEVCSTELANLRAAILLFRNASDAYAEQELRGIPRWKFPRRVLRQSFTPAYWMAAAAMFVTALFPLQVMRQHAHRTSSVAATSASISNTTNAVQSDEALLEDINRDISASVPTSMQALADPTEDASAVSSESTDATSNQRKD